MPVRISHVALYAEDLRAAEAFYERAFAAELLFREAVDADGIWHTLPLDVGWDDAAAADIRIDMVAVRRDDLILPVFVGRSEPRIIGLKASADEIGALHARLPEQARMLTHNNAEIVFADPFGVEWQVSTGTRFRSSGEMHGRWLAL